MIGQRMFDVLKRRRRWPFYVATTGAVLRHLDGAPTLFVPATQALFGLDERGAAAWPLLAHGAAPAALRERLGCAEADVTALLQLLEAAGAIRPLRAGGRTFAPVASRTVVLDDAGVRLHFEGARAHEAMRPIVDPLASEAAPVRCHLMVFERPDKVGLGFVGERVEWHDWSGAAPALRALLTTFILSDTTRPAIHAATLVRGDATTLLLGRPGAGKSTLAVALATRGFALAGDDAALLAPDGSVRPLAFPATLKEGSWSLVPSLADAIGRQPAFLRSDGKTVRYLPLDVRAGASVPPVRFIVDLRREKGARAAVSPMGAVETMGHILAGSWSSDNALSNADFRALCQGLDGAQGLSLHYDDLDEGAALLCDVCAGGSAGRNDRPTGEAHAA